LKASLASVPKFDLEALLVAAINIRRANLVYPYDSPSASFSCLLPARQSEYIARLTVKASADLLKGLEVDPECLALLQPPQRRVTHARFLCQPVEGLPLLFQQLVK